MQRTRCGSASDRLERDFGLPAGIDRMRAAAGEGATLRLADQRGDHAGDGAEPLAAPRAARHRDAGEQAARVGMRRRREDGGGGPRLHHLARVHHHDAGGDAGDDAEIVGDEHEAHGELALQLGQQVQDLRLDRHIERGGRLIGQDQRRRAHQRHGDHHPLAQAAGELVRVLLEAASRRGDADAVEQVDGALACLPGGRRGDGAAAPPPAGCRWCRPD